MWVFAFWIFVNIKVDLRLHTLLAKNGLLCAFHSVSVAEARQDLIAELR